MATKKDIKEKKALVKASRKASKKSEEVVLEKTSESFKKPNNLFRNIRKYGLIALGALLIIGAVWLINKFLVVAWVNNKPITRIEYINALEKQSGEAIKDQLIREKLIVEEASKKGIRISDQEIDSRIVEIEQQQGGKEALDQVLTFRGINRNDLRQLVKQQMLVERVFGGNINISEEDVNKYIEENKAQFAEATISAEQKEQVKESLKFEKINESYNNWLKDAMSSTSVRKS